MGTLWGLKIPEEGVGTLWCLGTPSSAPRVFAHPKGSSAVGAEHLQVPYGSRQPRGMLPATPWVPATPQRHGAGRLLPSAPAGTSGPGWR